MRDDASSVHAAQTLEFGRWEMTLLHQQHNDLRGPVAKHRFALVGVRRRLVAAFSLIHRAIVEGKLRRLRQALMLGDKWDF